MASVLSKMSGMEKMMIRLNFGANERLDFYNTIDLLLANRIQIHEALGALYKVHSQNGAKPKNTIARIVSSTLEGMAQGISFSESLGPWIPEAEAQLMMAGEFSGSLSQSFSAISQVINAKNRMIAAISSALGYPILLLSLTGFLLHMVASSLVPKLSQVIDPKLWTGASALLYGIATWVNGYGLISLIGLAVLVATIAVSLPYPFGRLRVWLDRIPPWSVYRMLQGSTFLLNVAALLQAGQQLNHVLYNLYQTANPWLKERILGAQKQIALGKNFGEALIDSGYEFPDRKANDFLSIISNYRGLEEAIASFAKRWLEESVKQIESLSSLAFILGLSAVGGILLLTLAGAAGLQNLMQTSGH